MGGAEHPYPKPTDGFEILEVLDNAEFREFLGYNFSCSVKFWAPKKEVFFITDLSHRARLAEAPLTRCNGPCVSANFNI